MAQDKQYNMLRGREIIEELRGRVDPRLVNILTKMAEDNAVTRDQNLIMAKMIDAQMHIIADIQQMLGIFKADLDKRMGARDSIEEVLPPRLKG